MAKIFLSSFHFIMRIQNINFNNTFKSLKLKNDDNNFSDTSFYRDPRTLIDTKEHLQKNFPKGCDILDFAGSNGEEAISLYSFFNEADRNKYKIYSFDTSKKAIDLAKKGIYTVFRPMSFDQFLLSDFDPDILLPGTQEYVEQVRNHFANLMEKTAKPNHIINDLDFVEYIKSFPKYSMEYYKIKDKYKPDFKFEIGNINNIEKFAEGKKVGAVLFRNAMYIETDNFGPNQFDFNAKSNIDKKSIIEKIVSKVHKVLEPNGVFVLGNIEKDHIYIADDTTKDEEKFFLNEFFIDIFKESPLWQALSKNKRFESIGYSTVTQAVVMENTDLVPTIWKKNSDLISKTCKMLKIG